MAQRLPAGGHPREVREESREHVPLARPCSREPRSHSPLCPCAPPLPRTVSLGKGCTAY